MHKTDVIVLCGGLGKRLREAVKDVPKPLANIKNVPFLDILINHISQNAYISNIILAAGYKGELIKNRYSKNISFNRKIITKIENKPLGTGGAIRNSLENVKTKNFMVINGDSFIKESLDKIIIAHQRREKKITITVRYHQNVKRYGRIVIDNNNCIKEFSEKNGSNHAGYINCGVYVFNKRWALDNLEEEAFSIEDKFQKLYLTEPINCFKTDANFIDIGTIKSYNESQNFFY